MGRKPPNVQELIKEAQRGMWLGYTITLALLIGGVLIAPSWRAATAIALMLAALAYRVGSGPWKRGPYAAVLAGAVVAGVVKTDSLVVENSIGETIAWLEVQNE